MKNFKIEAYNTLRELGIPAHLRGYEYLKSALNYLQENPDAIYEITTKLYPAVAKIHKTTPSKVERGIRNAIEQSKSSKATWLQVMGRAGHMSNGEFIATLREVVKMRLEALKEAMLG
jgi:two-component system response regulator (stage 0 sporulation protein A)